MAEGTHEVADEWTQASGRAHKQNTNVTRDTPTVFSLAPLAAS